MKHPAHPLCVPDAQARREAVLTALHTAEAPLPGPQPEPLMIDVRGVAALLGVSARHVQGLDYSGRLGPMPVKLGRSARWSIEEVREWVRAGCPTRPKWLARKEGKR